MGKGKKYNPNSTEAVFKRLYGVKPGTFEKMKGILQKEYDKLHKAGGSPEILPGIQDDGKHRRGLRRKQKHHMRKHPMGGKHACKRQNVQAAG